MLFLPILNSIGNGFETESNPLIRVDRKTLMSFFIALVKQSFFIIFDYQNNELFLMDEGPYTDFHHFSFKGEMNCACLTLTIFIFPDHVA
jgi:hypothetical protein